MMGGSVADVEGAKSASVVSAAIDDVSRVAVD